MTTVSSPKHPSLYEINTRILVHSLGEGKTLADIPEKYWKQLQKRGMDWVWLMGIWEIREKELDPNLIPPHMMDEFRTLLPELEDDDICGSPYAIHTYRIDPALGTAKDLKEIRKTLRKLGMKLMLDFVPNHLGAHTAWQESHPEYFIEVDEARYHQGRGTFYPLGSTFFAHGKDPYFDAWQDTIQVNYCNPEVHRWMTDTLINIGELCDGVRCDMAMLAVRRIFEQTWRGVTQWPDQLPEFWPVAIREVKKQHADFVFLAECYWDMEAELMEMGFDYCYDKVFYDRMTEADGDRMRQHFYAEPWWLDRTARFLENHDEPRAAHRLSLQKHMVSAALVAFGPGMRFWHMGQWEGNTRKIPVQLRTQPIEPYVQPFDLTEGRQTSLPGFFYAQLCDLAKAEIFREGAWEVLRSPKIKGLILWKWKFKGEGVLVTINYTEKEMPVSLNNLLEAAGIANAIDFQSGERLDVKTITALAPWAIGLWKGKSHGG